MSKEKPLDNEQGHSALWIGDLSIALTYRCTAECSHCFMASSASKDDPMTLSQAREYVAEAKEAGATSVWFYGGEPFLYFDLLSGAVEYARQVGLVPTATSNAFWAVSEKASVERLSLLKEKGLQGLSFSADPFHQEYVPLEHIRNAFKAAEALGISGYGDVTAYMSFVEEQGDEVVRRCREAATRLSAAYDAGVGGEVWFTGTAAEVLAPLALKQTWTTYDRCIWEDMLVGRAGSASVDPSGDVQLCTGIPIGNAKQRKLSEIIQTYSARTHPILGVLSKEGVTGLARMAMGYGFEPTEYADECHLCYEARKVLLNHYPEHLAPAIWYERAK